MPQDIAAKAADAAIKTRYYYVAVGSQSVKLVGLGRPAVCEGTCCAIFEWE